jgi:hypothetical protein
MVVATNGTPALPGDPLFCVTNGLEQRGCLLDARFMQVSAGALRRSGRTARLARSVFVGFFFSSSASFFASSGSFFGSLFEFFESFGAASNTLPATFHFLHCLARFGFLALSRSVGRSGFEWRLPLLPFRFAAMAR